MSGQREDRFRLWWRVVVIIPPSVELFAKLLALSLASAPMDSASVARDAPLLDDVEVELLFSIKIKPVSGEEHDPLNRAVFMPPHGILVNWLRSQSAGSAPIEMASCIKLLGRGWNTTRARIRFR